MKGLFLKSIAATIICAGMVACGGSNNGGGNDAAIDAFDNVIAMFEKFRQIKETEGIDKAREYEDQCLTELENTPLTFKVEIEPDIPVTINSFRMGTYNLNNESFFAIGKYERTGSGSLDDLNMVLFVDNKPVQCRRIENYPNEAEFHTAIDFHFYGSNISPEMSKVNRIVITRKNDSHFQDAIENVRQFRKAKQEPGDGTFMIGEKKLGPVTVGQPVANLPDTYNGLYDKFKHKKELHEDEMDGEWLEENYTFSKDGKDIFMAIIYENKVSSIRLLKDATFISTLDGISVGSSAREVFNKIRADWSTYYEGTAFATKGNFTYHISMDDLIRADVPHNTEQIKPDAKICMIECQ